MNGKQLWVDKEAKKVVDMHEADAGKGSDWIAHEPVPDGIRAECERRGIRIVVP